jgi:hypothetical protein
MRAIRQTREMSLPRVAQFRCALRYPEQRQIPRAAAGGRRAGSSPSRKDSSPSSRRLFDSTKRTACLICQTAPTTIFGRDNSISRSFVRKANASERWSSRAARHWSFRIGQGIAVRKETQQPNLLHDLDEREHGTLCACSPLLTVRHIVSNDVDLISQPRDLCEERSRSFGILLVPTQHITRIAAKVAPNIVYPASNSRHTGGDPKTSFISVTHRIPIVIAAIRSVIVVNTFCGVSMLTSAMIATV